MKQGTRHLVFTCPLKQPMNNEEKASAIEFGFDIKSMEATGGLHTGTGVLLK